MSTDEQALSIAAGALTMSRLRLFALTLLALLSFAANSVLCRLALRSTALDPASFSAIRLLSGALVLALLVAARRSGPVGGNWPSALALLVYACGFSFAYVNLSTGIGALILFGAVQVTMLLAGRRSGERLQRRQGLGLLLAIAGLASVMLPGSVAPPPAAALLMMVAGIAWGRYCLLGRGVQDALGATAGNFLRAAPLAVLLSIILLKQQQLDSLGVLYAILSGALASGLGYALWYAALRALTATRAAAVQLSVPVIAAVAGALLLHETVTLRLLLASVAILGGIALVVLVPAPGPDAPP